MYGVERSNGWCCIFMGKIRHASYNSRSSGFTTTISDLLLLFHSCILSHMYDSNRDCIIVLSPVVMTRELVRREPMFSNPETSTSELVKEAPREENGIENGKKIVPTCHSRDNYRHAKRMILQKKCLSVG